MTVLKIGNRVVMKKTHACGGGIFEVVRTGADIKLKCEKCSRVVMLPSDKALKAVKTVIIKGEEK